MKSLLLRIALNSEPALPRAAAGGAGEATIDAANPAPGLAGPPQFNFRRGANAPTLAAGRTR